MTQSGFYINGVFLLEYLRLITTYCICFSNDFLYLRYFRILLFHPRTCAEYFEKMTDILNIITQEPSKNNNAPYYPFTVSEVTDFVNFMYIF